MNTVFQFHDSIKGHYHHLHLLNEDTKALDAKGTQLVSGKLKVSEPLLADFIKPMFLFSIPHKCEVILLKY